MTTDITDLAQLRAELSNQANGSKDHLRKLALLLVEALEKAQAATTQQGNIASALLDEVTQLCRHADEKAPELRALLIEADSELEVLRQRIAELESRTVRLPHRNLGHDKLFLLCQFPYYDAEEMEKALAAAGIKVEAE
ncbi:TPA: hypothetical protein ACQ7IX_000720 [Klebsiella pneumoniae]